ncbi:radical SAM protein [Streptomyces galilaeus]|uniref:radical SAM protein n=1 Tax=Streptomyces galilaeus TaxID=33899 RepID=UPI001679AAFD|nr:radical SAM protein [Streptomyces galilaeus]
MDPILFGGIPGSFDDRRLQLFIIPAGKCKFRCTYCYERCNLGHMEPEVVQAVKAFIDRRLEHLDTLSVEWFGGDPLLAKPVIMDVAQHISSSLGSVPSIGYSGSVTTNGYLLDGDTAAALIRLGVRSFQISLDGPPDVHDESRVRADGCGTFCEIWDNLLALRDSDLSFDAILRLYFTPATAARLHSLIDLVNDAFADDSRFKVIFKAVARLGGENDHKLELFSPKTEREWIAPFRHHLFYESQLITHGPDEPQIWYAAKPNSFVIRADGHFSQSTVASCDDRNTLGCITEDGLIVIDNDSR